MRKTKDGIIKMRSNQDGTGVAPYAAETAREILELGPGGHGNFESLDDAMERGVTPGLVETTKQRAHEEIDAAAETEPLDLKQQSLIDGDGNFEKIDHDSTQKVREKAYELWTLEGRPDGRELNHWEMARGLVAQDEGSRSTRNFQ
jgi:hypothetical protein